MSILMWFMNGNHFERTHLANNKPLTTIFLNIITPIQSKVYHHRFTYQQNQSDEEQRIFESHVAT